MFFIVTLLIATVTSWITYRWAVSSFPWLDQRRRTLAKGFTWLIVSGPPLQWLVAHTRSVIASDLQLVYILIFVAMGLTAIPLALIHLACRPPRPGVAPPRARDPAPRPRTAVSRRQIIEATTGVALFGGAASVLGWGIVRGRHAFELRELAVRIRGLPRVLDGYVIVQISDIHAGHHVSETQIDEGLALVRKARPDLIAVTGDLVDIDPAFAPRIARKLVDLPTRDGVAACLGNHDYYAGAAKVAAALRAAGIATLIDEGRVLRAGDGGGFALLGVDDAGSRHYGRRGPRLAHATTMVPSDLPRILLSHQPPTVDDWAGDVALQLSGHTHGGQINPGGRTLNFLFEYVAGAYEVEGTTLYVNRGFGTVGPPARVGVAPEVTRIVLVAA